jgi:UPF0176 protein
LKRIETNHFVVCALYHFVRVDDPAALQQQLLELLTRHDVRGTLLVAAEGINGTVAGSRHAIDQLLGFLKADERFKQLVHKEAEATELPFLRTRVKLKKEIVTMGVPDIDPKEIVGTYVTPADWNALISDPDVICIDTRNDYEVEIGTFKGAVNPHTTTFREFPAYAEKHLDPGKHKKVAMFCTGGIRCEKSTAYMKSQGFEEVYHLEGGILNYLEQVPEADSLWEGECFVFDERVTVNHQLEPGTYDQCHACRMPISDADKASDAYVPGVSCPHCIDKKSEADRERYRQRELQMRLARERGEAHIGGDAQSTQARHSEEKKAFRESQRRAGSAGGTDQSN